MLDTDPRTCQCGFDAATYESIEEEEIGPYTIVQTMRDDPLRDEYVGKLTTVESSLLADYPPHGKKGLYKPVKEVATMMEVSHLMGFHLDELLGLADSLPAPDLAEYDRRLAAHRGQPMQRR